MFVKKAFGHDFVNAKGRHLKDGKFEISYGWNDKITTEAPPEEYFYPSGDVFFYREDRENHFPLKLEINEGIIRAEPALSNALKIAYAQSVKESAERFREQNKLLQYAPYIAVIIGFIIVGIAWWISSSQIAGELGHVAGAFNGVAKTLENATVVLQKPPPG